VTALFAVITVLEHLTAVYGIKRNVIGVEHAAAIDCHLLLAITVSVSAVHQVVALARA